MNDAFDPWFSSDFDRKRRAKLETITSFAEVRSKVDSAIGNIEVRVCPGTDPGITQCSRPEFTLYVDAESFDAFFNAQCGYRAQFARDAEVGLAANGSLISAIIGKLVHAAGKTPGLSGFPVRKSIEAASAKIWPLEDDLSFTHFRKDLAVPRWVQAADNGSEKAQMGLVAPEGTALEVKGAFLDTFGNEVVQASKIHRRYHIHELGFS